MQPLFLPCAGLLALLAAPLLAGCAANGTALAGRPSLDKRPGESLPLPDSMTAAPAPPGPASADLAARMAGWRAQATAGDAAFIELSSPTDALILVAADAPVGSENWVAAQQALSRLAAARAGTTAALADVDTAYLAQLLADDTGGLPALFGLRGELVAMAARQEAVMDGLAARLAR